MTKEATIQQKEQRLKIIEARDGAFKTPGVMRKLRREIRNLKKDN